jgi:hypothetical protein
MSTRVEAQSGGPPAFRGERRVVAAVIVVLLGTSIGFRLMDLSSVPGVSGDEGWWGIQALAWLSGQPYEGHTTSGNPIDLPFLVPVALVHALAPPSFGLLRIIPAFVNLLALPVGFWLARRLYGTATAWMYTTILAVLPTAIAHSRICQDPSQTVFWTGLIAGLSLLGFEARPRSWIYRAAAVLVFPIVLWTHPTNVFVAPFLLLPLAAAIRPRLPARPSAMLVVSSAILGVAVLAGATAAIRYVAASNTYLDKPWLTVAASRMVDPAQWLEFAVNNARLYNGVTIYHYFSGAYPPTPPYDAAFVIVALAALWGLLLRAGGGHSTVDRGLIVACAGTWLGFYAFAGPQALRPHAERWGLCLIAPGALVFARGLTAWMERTPSLRRSTIGAASLVGAGLLASFYLNYFAEFRTTGGRSHFTYVTAQPEPKQQAFEYVLARSGGAPVTIVAQQWWLERPLTYLAAAHPGVSVIQTMPAATRDVEEALRAGRLFFVEFVGTPELARAEEWIRNRGLRATPRVIKDAGGGDHLQILQAAALN